MQRCSALLEFGADQDNSVAAEQLTKQVELFIKVRSCAKSASSHCGSFPLAQRSGKHMYHVTQTCCFMVTVAINGGLFPTC